ncbi:MAG: hypothetical protein MJ202_00315 [Lentisphaeria bacterium]|nr:hypothetical protein [Lentisphaeria bacterium]
MSAVSFNATAFSLLQRWCDALIAYQVQKHADPRVRGALLCPACGAQHGRIGDMVLPMTCLWRITGESRYLEAACLALDWLECTMLRPDQGYRNDYKEAWSAITVFAQIALGHTLEYFGQFLPAELRTKWQRIFQRQSEYLYGYFHESDRGAVVNYPASYCLAMMLAWKLLEKEEYRQSAQAKAKTLYDHFLEDGMLSGEGHSWDTPTQRGCQPVDLGYNLEESLPNLCEYAERSGDERMKLLVERSALAHLEFVLPDGGIDNSMGCRSAKWTYYGSRTSDGALPLYAAYAVKNPVMARALRVTLELYARCTSSEGLLYGGLMYAEAGEAPCIHHTFIHAKALAMVLCANLPDNLPEAPLPRETARGVRTIRSLDTRLAAFGPWRASFSANDSFTRVPGTFVGGGSLAMLWHRKLGVVCAATMSRYGCVERVNMQDLYHEQKVLCMTPRIEDQNEFSSTADGRVTVEANVLPDALEYTAKGHLTKDIPALPVSAPFCLRYGLKASGLTISASSENAFRYVLPVVAAMTDQVVLQEKEAVIRRPEGTIRITASKPLALLRTSRGDRAFSPIAGLLCACFYVEGAAGETIDLTLNVAE